MKLYWSRDYCPQDFELAFAFDEIVLANALEEKE